MFEIPDGATVFVDHVQTRMEKHGDENVPALDVALTWLAPAETLDALCEGLSEILFTNVPPHDHKDAQLQFEGGSGFSFVRFPALKMPIGVIFESVGYGLCLRKIGQSREVVLSNCKIGKIRLVPKDGGQVEISLLVQCAENVSADVAGTLDVWQQAGAYCILTPPAEEGSLQADIEDDEPMLP